MRCCGGGDGNVAHIRKYNFDIFVIIIIADKIRVAACIFPGFAARRREESGDARPPGGEYDRSWRLCDRRG